MFIALFTFRDIIFVLFILEVFMKLEYVNKNNYKNVLEVLKLEFNMSDRLILKLKKTSNIYLNNKPCFVCTSILSNDVIRIIIDFEEDNSNIAPIKMDLDILYEDDGIIAINKPPFMPVHPSHLHYLDSLSNGVKYYFDSIGLNKKIRPINRLDKDTSGIVLFAKNEYIQECLVKQMKAKSFVKEYIAVLDGKLPENEGTICAPIARKANSILEREVSENGDVAITHYKVIKEYENFSIVKFILETGRTHQIRVHSAYIGCPIVGDTLYGKASSLINRQALHAYKVLLVNPITKKQISIVADLPKDILNVFGNDNLNLSI